MKQYIEYTVELLMSGNLNIYEGKMCYERILNSKTFHLRELPTMLVVGYWTGLLVKRKLAIANKDTLE